jgi:hypothetical protein
MILKIHIASIQIEPSSFDKPKFMHYKAMKLSRGFRTIN